MRGRMLGGERLWRFSVAGTFYLERFHRITASDSSDIGSDRGRRLASTADFSVLVRSGGGLLQRDMVYG